MITCGIYLYSIPIRKILVCHATNASWKQWSIPKGLQEKDEALWDTAVREFHEETNLKITELCITNKIKLPPVKYRKQNKVLEAFLVVIEDDLTNFNFRSIPGKQSAVPEINKWQWITLPQASVWLHEAQCQNLTIIKEITDKCISDIGQKSTPV